jgi:hypothetical protein
MIIKCPILMILDAHYVFAADFPKEENTENHKIFVCFVYEKKSRQKKHQTEYEH